MSTITTVPAVPVDADVEPWAVTDEDAAILRHDFGDGRRLEYWLPRRAIPVDFDGHQATVNVDPAEVVRWSTFVDHVKADVVFSGKPDVLQLWFALNLEGITAVEAAGRVDLIDSDTGALLGVLPAPFLLDSERDRHECAWQTGTGCILAYLPDLDEQLWLGAVFDPTTIDTSTFSTATGYGNQKKLLRLSTGMLVIVFAATSTNAELWYSSDNGATWTQYAGADIAGWANGSITSILIGATEYLVAVWYQSGTGGGRSTTIVYGMVGSFNAGRTTITWGAAVDLVGGASNSNYNFPDVAVALTPGSVTTAEVVFVASYHNGAQNFVAMRHSQISSTALGATIADAGTSLLSGNWRYILGDFAQNAETYPTVDVNPTNGYFHVGCSTGNTGAGQGIRYKRATNAAGALTWGTERIIDTTRYIDSAARWMRCMWDGTRVVFVGELYDGANYDLVAHERDSGDTTTTTNELAGNLITANRLDFGSATYDAAGNLHIWGVNQDEADGSKDLVYRKWTRSGASLGAEVVVDATVGDAYISAKVGYSNTLVEIVYRDLAASPYDIRYSSQSLNAAPTAATWVTTAGPADIAATLTTAWTPQDPDAGDTMSAYALKRDIGGTVRYWRASDSTWQVAEVKNISATASVTQAAGWGLDADADHGFYVKTWDALDTEGVYNTALYITPSAKVNPTLDTPAAAATVATSSLDAAWTVAQQSAYLLELLDNAGTTVLWTSGWVVDAAARVRTIAYTLATATGYKVRLTTKNTEGLASTSVTHSLTTAFTAPATPTLTATATDSNADGVNDFVRVVITNPAPGGSQPAISGNDLYRRETLVGGVGIRIASGLASGATYDDYAVSSGVAYQYLARALGVTTVTADSAWTS